MKEDSGLSHESGADVEGVIGHQRPSPRTDSAQCPHSDLDINFHLTTMIDSNVGSFHLWAVCKICTKRMNFGRGLAMGASSRGPTRDSEPDKRGILIPMIAEGDEPTKEWGFFLSAPRVVTPGDD